MCALWAAEVQAAAMRAKNRSVVLGAWKPSVLKKTAPMLSPALAAIFSATVRAGCLPACWANSAISPVPKSGADHSVCDGYRGIAVGTLPAKLYATILNQRLNHWAEATGIRAEGQFGFRAGRSCSQAALILRTTIERQRAAGAPLYACFVDFQKAYDSVPRHLLWTKMERAGVSGWWLQAAQALYADVSLCVRAADGYSASFKSTQGVKQGCPLSPTMFGFYLDDLPASITTNTAASSSLPRMHDGYPVPPLLYADDLVLLATTAAGMQAQLDALNTYSASWGLTVNTNKTKLVVFDAGRRRQPDAATAAFTCGGTPIELVPEFRYLGIQFHASAAFCHAAGARITAARGALGAMRRRCAELGATTAHLQIRMFDCMVNPVLNYSAEVWAPQLVAAGGEGAASRVHLDFLRQLLGVRKSTPALVVLAETGRRPQSLSWAKQTARFWNRVLQADDGSLVKRALLDSCALAVQQGTNLALAKRSWAAQVDAAMTAVGQGGISVSLDQPRQISLSVLARISNAWVSAHLSAEQGTMYRQYVEACGTGLHVTTGLPARPRYLSVTHRRSRWRALAQLRTGSHWLAEARGRVQRLDREQRVCQHCVAAAATAAEAAAEAAAAIDGPVEDAAHAILSCPCSAPLRGKFPDLFSPPSTVSLHAFFSTNDAGRLASFALSLYRLHHPATH